MATKKKKKAATKASARKASKPVKRKAARRPAAKVARSAPAKRVLKPRHEPETLRLRSAAPSFTVNDVMKSLAFYQDVLGFVLKERWEGDDGELRGVELQAGRITFMLGQDDWKLGRERVKGQGFRMYCATGQDIDKLAAGIKARGGVLTEEPGDRPWGSRDFAVEDPDGFKITISSEYN
jgi:uncharacterized glyoxalase superfamily protein PhnB